MMWPRNSTVSENIREISAGMRSRQSEAAVDKVRPGDQGRFRREVFDERAHDSRATAGGNQENRENARGEA